MNKQHNTDKTAMADAVRNRLLEQIERYFDCALSDSEEQQLRRQIAATPISHPAIDEVRALMGFRRPRRSGGVMRRHVAVAASIAVVLLAAINIARPGMAVDSTCIAYAGGERITDQEAVLSILADSMSDFSEGLDEANNSLESGMQDVAETIQRYEYEIDFPEI